MARWLKLQLAQRHGICSNCQFPFPRAFSYERLQGRPARACRRRLLTSRRLLVWQIMKQLPAFLGRPEFASLASYLGHEQDSRKLFQLADRIAYVFDQYLVFRPDLVRQWESGAGQDWQATLWREVSAPFREQHPAALQARFIQPLEQAAAPVAGLPERIAIFGISALPPFYLQILAALARHIEVSLFLLEPCEAVLGLHQLSAGAGANAQARRQGSFGGGSNCTLKKAIACWPRWGNWEETFCCCSRKQETGRNPSPRCSRLPPETISWRASRRTS